MSDEQLAEHIREIAIFALTHGGNKCFSGWPAHTVFKYLAAHHLNGSLYVVQDGKTIKAMGVAWKDDEGNIQVREVIGKRQDVVSLWNALYSSVNGFRRVLTYRMIKDSLTPVEIPTRAIERFMNIRQSLTVKTEGAR